MHAAAEVVYASVCYETDRIECNTGRCDDNE